jgi:hypothetical protein
VLPGRPAGITASVQIGSIAVEPLKAAQPLLCLCGVSQHRSIINRLAVSRRGCSARARRVCAHQDSIWIPKSRLARLIRCLF